MRIGKLFGAVNWRYALGELALIFVGITLALAASAWYEDQQERQEEISILRQFRVALSADLEELERIFETENEVHAKVSRLLDHLAGNEPYSQEVGDVINAILTFRGVRANVSAYEALKSRGFELVSDEELRFELINYYEELAPALRDIYQNDRDMVTEQAIPYYYEHFRAVGTWQFVPVDYEQLRRDVHFHNLAMLKISRLEVYILPNQESAIEKIRNLQRLVDSQLQLHE